jgi:hypothetical protein
MVGYHTSSSETSGRIVFGAFGIFVAMVALAAWWSFAKALISNLRQD